MTTSSSTTHSSQKAYRPPTLVTNPIVARPVPEPGSGKPVLVSGPILAPVHSVDLKA